MKNKLFIYVFAFIILLTGCGKGQEVNSLQYDEIDLDSQIENNSFDPIDYKDSITIQDITFSIKNITTSHRSYDTGEKQILVNADIELKNESKSDCDLTKFLDYRLLSSATKRVFGVIEESSGSTLKSGSDLVKSVSFDITPEVKGQKSLYIFFSGVSFQLNVDTNEEGLIASIGKSVGAKTAPTDNTTAEANNSTAEASDTAVEEANADTAVIPDEEIIFEDEMLETMVRKHLGKSRGDSIMSSDLAEIEQLFIYNKFIFNLDDVESFKGTKLFFKDDYIDKYSDMSSYDDMAITTFKDLQYFKNLEVLYIQKSRYDYDGNGDGNTPLSVGEIITEINDLPNAGTLTTLCINTESNTFRNKGSLDTLPDMSNLVNMEFLDLAYNNIVNIESLESLKKLRLLNLRMNYVEDISPLAELTELQELYLGYNKIASLKDLANLKNLYTLSAQNQSIDDDVQVSNNFDFNVICNNLTKLIRLNLTSSDINDITGISNLPNLEVLDLAHVDIDNYNKYLDELYEAPKLKLLAVTGQIDKQELDKTKVITSLTNYDPYIHPWDYIFINRALLMNADKW